MINGLFYKPMMIVNEDSGVVNKLEASLTDDARVAICDCHMFIVQARSVDWYVFDLFSVIIFYWNKVWEDPKAWLEIFLAE